LDGLVQSGAKIVDITIPKLDQMRVAHAVSILSEMCTSLLNHREHWEELSPATQASLYLARSFAPEYYIKAQRLRTEALAVFDQAFALADVIATPTTAITAPEIPAGGLKNGWSDLSLTTELMRFAFPSNFTGHPALSVPVGYDGKGLPIGLQLIGKHWQEDFLLGLGFKVEAQTAWRAPTTHFPLL
jgi:Asp-tRNA(Asn)/Glu-tRNA(Gln) amidotransferase A subunit family amidase